MKMCAQKIKLLIVEDEEPILQGLMDLFSYHGYEVDSAMDGQQGLDKALTGTYDLVLLDCMLPSRDGFSICKEIRKKDREQPIIMLTAKTEDEDIVNGLSLGADDYIAKPFSIRQLALRVEAVLRRSRKLEAKEAFLEIHPELKIDQKNLLALISRSGESCSVELTRREVEVLQFLKKNDHRPVSREELLVEVWGYPKDSRIETRTVDIHITKIRRKIEINSKNPLILQTLRGEGYRLGSGDILKAL